MENQPAASAAPACTICGSTTGPFFAAGPANEQICKACDAEMNGPLLGKAEPPPATTANLGPLLGKAEPLEAARVQPPQPPGATVGRTLTVPAVRQPPVKETYPPQAHRGRSHTTPNVTYPPQWKR